MFFNCNEKYDISELKKEFDYVIIATGAWEKGINSVKEGQEKILDSLDFLKKSKNEREHT